MKKLKNLFFIKNTDGDKELNKQFMITFVSVLATVMCTIGVSLAAFVWSDNSEKEQNLLVGNLELTISSDSEALGSGLDYPVADEDAGSLVPYTFTIKNTGKLASNYSIKIVADEDAMTADGCLTNQIDTSYIKFSVDGAIKVSSSTLSTYDSTPFTTGVLAPNESKTYNIRLWISSDAPNSVIGQHYHGKILLETSQLEEAEPFDDKSGANTPVLADNMIPVRYDDINNMWVKADEDSWYNYETGMWANAVIISTKTPTDCYEWDGEMGDVDFDGEVSASDITIFIKHTSNASTVTDEETLKRMDLNGDGTIDANDTTNANRLAYWNCNTETSVASMTAEEYLAAEPGTPINPLMISSFWTWIPRFKYKINNTGTTALPSAVDVVFESGTEATGVDINTEGVAVTEYYTHPAFRDGSTVYKTEAYDQGGWDSELTGFWVQKYETFSGPLSNSSSERISSYVDFEFGMMTSIRSYPIIKNTQWGAIAYLSQSKYGKKGNSKFLGVNKEIYINSNENLYVGRSGGSPTAETFTTGGYTYNGYTCKQLWCIDDQEFLSGAGASTTGNVYGVYDMNGGAGEYVMANYDGNIASSYFTSDYFTTEDNKKYYDNYTADKTYILGDATYETSGWYSDNAVELSSSSPFYIRGGTASGGASSGIFSYESNNGGAYEDVSYGRTVMIVQ